MGPCAAGAAAQAFWPAAKTLMPGQFICPEVAGGVGAIQYPLVEVLGGRGPHAAQDAEALFRHFTFSMQEAYQPT